ncbi:hypothetical protein IFM89_019552 [Coptis chinensis]|uniref:NmrA-like domain-containing protein n=1 Tax=Coptis chinensis TaxID=261450 RepID=A0A835I689_9MAGN|nr:hypothetical protein IFM89_019552 [Coptis chinensis]
MMERRRFLFSYVYVGRLGRKSCSNTMCKGNGNSKVCILFYPQLRQASEVPLMEIKYCTEKFIQDSGLNYIIIRLCGFMQGLIGQYAVPILEEKSVWGTDAPTRIAYMDTQVNGCPLGCIKFS